MADIVSPETRSRMMSGIRGKDTKPEMIIRSGLHRRGFRFRIHDKRLPGKPDLVFPRHNAIIFVHGCFWHGHDCPLFKWPKTRPEFWKTKINRNREVDIRSEAALKQAGWRIGTIWECSLKNKKLEQIDLSLQEIENWLRSTRKSMTL